MPPKAGGVVCHEASTSKRRHCFNSRRLLAACLKLKAGLAGIDKASSPQQACVAHVEQCTPEAQWTGQPPASKEPQACWQRGSDSGEGPIAQ